MPSAVMQTTLGNQNNVPAFLMKLWRLVEDEKCDDLICWSSGGTTFFIRDQSRFAKELLPLYFKHNNMASFVRQLNMYGFRKVVNIEQGGLRTEKDEYEFQHMYFLKGNEYLLELIKRKVTTGKGQPPQEEVKVEPQLVSKMLVDVKQLHGKQENLDLRLSSMKSENEVLWREVANLRQQHKKQQQIVNKLIQFLLSLVHPKRSNPLGVRRKIPLMLNDVSHSAPKSPRYSRSFSVGNNISSCSSEVQEVNSGDFGNDGHIDSENLKSPCGPVIHDITDTFDAEAFLKGEVEAIPTISENSPVSGTDGQTHEVVAGTSLNATIKSSSGPLLSNVTHQEEAVGNLNDLINVIVEGNTEATPSASTFIDAASQISDILVPVTEKDLIKLQFEEHLDTLQLELDGLKDFLSGSGCTIDPVSLLGVCPPSSFMQLFSNEDISSNGTMDSVSDFGNFSNGNEIVGTEVTQYNPSSLGLGDDVSIFDTDAILPHSPETCLNSSLFECVDGINDKADDDAIQVSIPEQIDESFFHTASNEDIKPSQSIIGEHAPLDIATAEILDENN